jgi:hypothetical protein
MTFARRVDKGVFPLDERWPLEAGVYSRELAQQMVWLSGLLALPTVCSSL